MWRPAALGVTGVTGLAAASARLAVGGARRGHRRAGRGHQPRCGVRASRGGRGAANCTALGQRARGGVGATTGTGVLTSRLKDPDQLLYNFSIFLGALLTTLAHAMLEGWVVIIKIKFKVSFFDTLLFTK